MEKNDVTCKIAQEQADEILESQSHLNSKKEGLDLNAQQVISRQANLNICISSSEECSFSESLLGILGQVTHGKSTTVKALSGVQPVKINRRFPTLDPPEYTNAKIFKCQKCPAPKSYVSYPSSQPDDATCSFCGRKLVLMRHVAFIDCMSRQLLMSSLLTLGNSTDAAFLLIAANESCPQPQLVEQLALAELKGLNSLIILQNKIDIAYNIENQAAKNYEEIKSFVKTGCAENTPIIPVSVQLKYNIDAICQYLCEYIPRPLKDRTSDPELLITKSYDNNKPGETPENLRGGVIQGRIQRGVLKVGDEIEIRPGLLSKDSEGNIECYPLRSKIVELRAEKNDLLYAVPGGIISCTTLLDPALARSNRLVGQVVGYPGSLPEIYIELVINYQMLKDLERIQSGAISGSEKVTEIEDGEVLMIALGTASSIAKIKSVSQEKITLLLIDQLICARINDKIAISREGQVSNRRKLFAWGTIVAGKTVSPKSV